MPGLAGGIRAAVPIVLGYLPLGFAYGMLARDAGLSLGETVLMSILVYAGSAQFIAVSLLAAGATPIAIIFTVFLVNLRHMLMSASLVPYLRNWSLPLLSLVSAEITDETFAVSLAYYQQNPPQPGFQLGLNLTSHLTWVTASLLGAVFGNLISQPEQWGFNFALPAMFIALLMLQIRSRPSLVVAIIAGILSLFIAAHIPGNWYIILATLLAATLGVLLEQWRLI